MQPSDLEAFDPGAAIDRRQVLCTVPITLPALLVTALVALDLAVFAWHTPRVEFPSLSGLAYLALAFSQISLATIWAALATTHGILRGLVLASTVSVLIAALLRFEPIDGGWVLLVGIQVAALGAPLLLLRYSGSRLTVEADANADRSGQAHQVQFSLRNIFVVTTAIAILLGVLRGGDFPWSTVVVFCTIGLLFAAIGWVSTWSVFGPHAWRQRLAVLLLFGPLVGGFLAGMIRGGWLFVGSHAALNLVQSLLLAGSLLVLRIAGFRLQKGAENFTGSRLSRAVVGQPPPA